MKKNKILSIVLITLLFSACKEDSLDAPPLNTEELITSVYLSFTDTSDLSQREFAFVDPDGPGGNNPVRFDTVELDSQSTYSLEVLLLDESGPNTDTINTEIVEEANDHIFCFNIVDVDLSIEITDSDGQYPLGLQSQWSARQKSTGFVQLQLKHQPDEKDGLCNHGSSDIDINFPIIIEN